jgi:peroxiredoxin Q/BCP
MTVTIGNMAPDFQLPSGSGRTVTLSEFRGSKVLLYFYPKDLTPACTTQACDFRDSYGRLSEASTVVIGISTDPASRHARFSEKYSLPFLLLADEEHAVAELYGVWQEKVLYGRAYMGIVRSTFLIGEYGELLREWRNIRVKGHVDQVLQVVEKMEL